MKDYSTFDPTDLAQDDQFLTWTKYPGKFPEIDRFWENWVLSHPEKAAEVIEAKELIHTVIEDAHPENLSEIQKAVWLRIQESMRRNSDAADRERFWKPSYRIAAGIALLISLVGIWYVVNKSTTQATHLSVAKGEFADFVNDGDAPKTIVLSDGSSVALQPHSKLHYPVIFSSVVREVELEGEAFFEIAKNPSRPFLVYADQLVTKVLGTSFIVRSRKDGSPILVQVKTGKVSVFTQSDILANKNKKNAQLDGLVLTPNQQVSFLPKESRMVKSLVDNPEILNRYGANSFVFRDVPLKQVFATLQQAYGIQIIYDESIASCSINASLDDMPLYDKMRVICKGLDGHYEILDSNIIFTSPGCK